MNEGGLSINVTDVWLEKMWISVPPYLISKAGLDVKTCLLSKTFAIAICVNAITPGVDLPSAGTTAKEWKKLVTRLPLRQSVSPEVIANAIEFLIKNESVTRQTIVVGGGYSLL